VPSTCHQISSEHLSGRDGFRNPRQSSQWIYHAMPDSLRLLHDLQTTCAPIPTHSLLSVHHNTTTNLSNHNETNCSTLCHKLKWLHLTGEVDKSVRCSCQTFSTHVKLSPDLTHQNLLKSVNFWQSYSQIKRWTFFGTRRIALTIKLPKIVER